MMAFHNLHIPVISSDIPVIGEIFFSQDALGLPVYLYGVCSHVVYE